MYIIGFDFDNTIVCYEGLFQKVAIENNLVPKKNAISKKEIRDYLRKINKEDIWTELQGYIYGKCMMDAEPFPGVFEFLQYLDQFDIKTFIISHRTRYPFLGPQYDLHQAAKEWLSNQKIHNSGLSILSPENIFFELTKIEKIQRIISSRCTHYMDDLPEILEKLPNSINKILFSPDKINSEVPKKWDLIQSWKELKNIIRLS